MDAASTVLGGTVVITGARVFADTATGHFTMQPVVSGFLLGSALLLVAMFAPSIAKALVILGMVGTFVTSGPTILDRVGKLG
jgi:formate/nitrite transporter FocA (FNT family)